MQNLFTSNCLDISVMRDQDSTLRLRISSDFSGSNRKSQLWVNEDRLAKDVETFWKSVKTKKLLAAQIRFSEIDWYDDMTDMYETPFISIKRGLKRAKIGSDSHGSIPKDWSIDFAAKIADTTTISPIIEVVKAVLGRHFNSDVEKDFTKKLRLVLQRKANSANFYRDGDE